jgi:hypothetical protein
MSNGNPAAPDAAGALGPTEVGEGSAWVAAFGVVAFLKKENGLEDVFAAEGCSATAAVALAGA